MSVNIFKGIQNLWHVIVSDAKTELVNKIEPGLELLTQNGGANMIAKGEAYLTAAVSGSPWAVVIEGFLPIAAAEGVTLTKEIAGAILNFAQTNLIAKSAGVPVTNPVTTAVNSAALATPATTAA